MPAAGMCPSEVNVTGRFESSGIQCQYFMHMILLVQCKCPRELVEIHNTVVLKGIFRRGGRGSWEGTCWGRRRTNVISNSHPHFPSDLLDIADFATSVGGTGNIPGRWPRSTSCPSAEFGPSAPTTKSRSSRSASRSPSSLDRMGKFFPPNSRYGGCNGFDFTTYIQ